VYCSTPAHNHGHRSQLRRFSRLTVIHHAVNIAPSCGDDFEVIFHRWNAAQKSFSLVGPGRRGLSEMHADILFLRRRCDLIQEWAYYTNFLEFACEPRLVNAARVWSSSATPQNFGRRGLALNRAATAFHTVILTTSSAMRMWKRLKSAGIEVIPRLAQSTALAEKTPGYRQK